MSRITYSTLDPTKIVRPNGTFGGGTVAGNLFVSSESAIIHNDMAVPAGTSFSYEASVGPGTSSASKVGLCTSNTSVLNTKEIYLEGGTNIIYKFGVATPFTLTTSVGMIVHFDYNATTGDVTIRAGANSVTVPVPELVGNPVYAFGTAPNSAGGLVFNFGATPFSLPVKDGHQGGIYRLDELDYLGMQGKEQRMFDSVFGNYFDAGTYLGNSGIVAAQAIPVQKRVDVADTQFVYVHAHHGLGKAGKADGFGLKNHIGRNSKQIRMTPVVRFNQTAAMKTNGFEQNKQEPFKPREFWGDY
jgi:hypothetical protein